MKKLFGVLAAALLCACSQDGTRIGADGVAASASAASGASAAIAQLAAAHSFANAPDRGGLVEYAGGRTHTKGAYTWHPVSLSERHALQAIVDGEMTIPVPGGNPVTLKYERHVEHDNGNWSWIGRSTLDPGQTSVITFGAEAAFGTVPMGPDAPALRLTTVGGRPWIVSTDRNLVRELHNAATRPTAPDYLVPPGVTGGKGMQAAAASAATASASASATNTLDVVVGYTNGFATARGGTSAAVTRIQNLVDITNEAYVSSNINWQVRLVGTLAVNYADATSNQTTLEELTGFRAPSTTIPVNPVFNALRAARETYGADLVSLVRQFKTPENAGCGIAWLLGGGGQVIDQGSQMFGYSVVSDGQDAGDGGTYFCREETFAHELGHNLGSNHDTVTAGGQQGAYPFSFGYKTSVANGNFYTIMAYGDQGQSAYRVFSNPAVTTCGGRACGVANQADNARSINLTAPIISAFRATVVVPPGPTELVHNDIDGNEKSDVLLYRPGTFAYWVMDANVISRARAFTLGTGLVPVATGDFDGNGRADVAFKNASRQIVVWLGDGTVFTSGVAASLASSYEVIGAGDVNADGKDDLLLHRAGQLAHWVMNGAKVTSSKVVPVDAAFKPAVVGDFDNNGRADIAWRNTAGDVYFWLANTSDYTSSFVTKLSSTYTIRAASDIDGDGKSDLLLHRPGQMVQFVMNGASIVRSRAFTVVTSHNLVSTGDFNGDGRGDVVWQNTDGNLYMWLATSTEFYTSRTMTKPVTGLVPIR